MDSEIMKQVGGSCFCMVYRQFILLLSLLQEVKKVAWISITTAEKYLF